MLALPSQILAPTCRPTLRRELAALFSVIQHVPGLRRAQTGRAAVRARIELVIGQFFPPRVESIGKSGFYKVPDTLLIQKVLDCWNLLLSLLSPPPKKKPLSNTGVQIGCLVIVPPKQTSSKYSTFFNGDMRYHESHHHKITIRTIMM